MNAFARRDQIGFEAAVASWPATREKTDAVSVRPEAVSCANCNHSSGVPWISDTERGVTLVRTVLSFETLVPMIAGSGDYHHAALNQTFTFIADRRAATGEVADVMRDRQTQIRAVNGHEIISRIQVANELQRRNDRKLGVFDLSAQHSEIVQLDVVAHSVGKTVVISPSGRSFRRFFIGADDSGDVRTMIRRRFRRGFYLDEPLYQFPMDQTRASIRRQSCQKRVGFGVVFR